ncbi:MAG: bifunctional phosphopantothenoylcysteine decarboxylase/phosphopantothenate--cysteine ligase CoaBC [Micrococcales bacterium]|nr:bifunctional phosphopantothenoylcysteine decarboxylase/phosphopantothenate--cysteine ligase CoaBC [Micrococcales bacterium]
MRVILGVSGGIAAYKACSLLRLLTEAGHDVIVVPTVAALEFVGAPTWAALSGNPVNTEVWTDAHEVPHVRIGQSADVVIVAPATANLLAKAAAGLADDLLTNTLLTARCPVAFAPAMHTEMWEHPATQANVATLRARGAQVIDPDEGRLTGPDTGAGRLPEPEALYAAVLALVERTPPAPSPRAGTAAYDDAGPLEGATVVVSAGGTREPLDPVRYIGNRSSGKQGYAIAREAAVRGAEVTLVSANVSLPAPDGVTLIEVETTLELQQAIAGLAASADVIVMAAAPADFRPAHAAAAKIKKDPEAPGGVRLRLDLLENPDIVKGLVADRAERGGTRPVIVSFAAETGDESASVMDHARAKFARKGSDLQVVNEVGAGRAFGRDDNTVHILRRGTEEVVSVGPASKDAIAAAVLDYVLPLLP